MSTTLLTLWEKRRKLLFRAPNHLFVISLIGDKAPHVLVSLNVLQMFLSYIYKPRVTKKKTLQVLKPDSCNLALVAI